MLPFKVITVIILYMINISNILWAQNTWKEVLFSYSDFYPTSVEGFSYVVVEPYFFTAEDIRELKKQNDTVLAYLSVGEVDQGSWFYERLKPHSIGKNKIWKSEIISLANPGVYEVLIRLVDLYIGEKGYDGIFLDNVDNYTEWGPTPEHKDALVAFLKDAKERYLGIKFMQNAGLEIIADTAPYVDVLAIESVASDYNFKTQTYQLRDYRTYMDRALQIEKIEKQYHLPIIAIEYADEMPLRNKIIARIKPYGWSFFIGQIDLQGLPVFEKH